jgi:aryl sulfotransferase
LFGRAELGAPIATLSPWLDVNIFTDDDIFGILDAQEHRRFIKTHTPLDGIPSLETVTYLTVFRHPLDVALSYLDHRSNMDRDRLVAMLSAASGPPELPTASPPDDPAEFLRWWIEADDAAHGTGTNGLADYAGVLAIAWARRERPNVHLFHYAELCDDLDGQIGRLAAVLGIELTVERRREYVTAGTFDAMRERAAHTAPFADTGHFRDPANFFVSGGERGWREMLTADEIAAAERRLAELAGEDAARWAWRSPT